MGAWELRLLELGERVAHTLALGDTMRWLIYWRHNETERPAYQGRKREWR